MSEQRRPVSEVPKQEIELIRLRYIVGEFDTLADVAQKCLISFYGLKTLSAAEGWGADRAAFRMEAAQGNHYDTGVHVSETHALLMRSVRDATRAASDAAATAADTGDDDDFEKAIARIERLNKLLGAVKANLGAAASGLPVVGPQSGGLNGQPTPALPSGASSEDATHVPTNTIRNVQEIVAKTLHLMTSEWSTQRQRDADERQMRDAAAQGIDLRDVTEPKGPPPTPRPAPAYTAAPAPTGPQVIVVQTPPGSPPI